MPTECWWGCQNNSHGHLSFLCLFRSQVDKQQVGNADIFKLEEEIAKELERTIFLWKNNLIKQQMNEWIRIDYTTGERFFVAHFMIIKRRN